MPSISDDDPNEFAKEYPSTGVGGPYYHTDTTGFAGKNPTPTSGPQFRFDTRVQQLQRGIHLLHNNLNGCYIYEGVTGNCSSVQGDQHNTTYHNYTDDRSLLSTPDEKAWRRATEHTKESGEVKILKWSKEVDKQITTAGLISFLFALFAIQSYQWMSDDSPSALLLRITAQLAPGAATATLPSFKPSSSIIRINCFWFLSLALSLLSTLFALLCKQWLSEFDDPDIKTGTHLEALALERLRITSLEQWGVVSLMKSITVFLQLSILSFFFGLLEALWSKNIIVFALSLAIAGIGFGVYGVTTFLPSLEAFRRAKNTDTLDKSSPTTLLDHLPSVETICPFKSPQSWVLFTFTRQLLQTRAMNFLFFAFSKRYSFGFFSEATKQRLGKITSWGSSDLGILRVFSDVHPDFRIYEILGLRWLFRTFRESPYMVKDIEEIANNTPFGGLALIAAYDQWKLYPWIAADEYVEEQMLLDPDNHFAEQQIRHGINPHISRDERITSPDLLNKLWLYQLYWTSQDTDHRFLYEMTESLYRSSLPKQIQLPFIFPFDRVQRLWVSDSKEDREIGLDYLDLYEEGWEIARELDSGRNDQLALVIALAKHIRRNPTSELATAPRSLGLIRHINNSIIADNLYADGDWAFSGALTKWTDVLGQLRESRRLPGIEEFPSIPRIRGGLSTPLLSSPSRAAKHVLQSSPESYIHRSGDGGHPADPQLTSATHNHPFEPPSSLVIVNEPIPDPVISPPSDETSPAPAKGTHLVVDDDDPRSTVPHISVDMRGGDETEADAQGSSKMEAGRAYAADMA